MTTILLVIAMLVLLIVVHELGHFIAAKIFGVKVEEFGFGFPPRAFTFGRWGGTEYTLNWIPFGGFVRLYGDVGEGKSGEGSLVGKSRRVQAAILFAGVFMNAVAAWVLFAGALYLGVPRAIEDPIPGATHELFIAQVVQGSPADAAGIIAGDTIVALADSAGNSTSFLTPEDVTEFIKSRPGETLEITYLRSGEEIVVPVRPAHAIISDAVAQPAIGVVLVLISSEPLSPLQALKEAFVSTYNAFGAVTTGLLGMVKNAFAGLSPLEHIVGPVGLIDVVGAAAESGMASIFALAAFISVNLVIINLLPIPALDGGRLFILGIEALMRRNAPHLAVRLFNTFGFAFIILLMIAVTWNDIARLIA